MFAEEIKVPVPMQVLDLFEKAAAERARQDSYREEEPRLAWHPAVGVGGESAAGHNAVRMRMMGQGRAPGM